MVMKQGEKSDYIPMILMNSVLEPGNVMGFIQSIKDPTSREMAMAEYYYFTGNHIENANITSKYLDHYDFNVKASAWLMYSFCNMTLCRQEETKRGMKFIYDMIKACQSGMIGQEEQAMIIFIANAASVLIHLQIDEIPPLNKYLRLLPPGLRVFGCYIMAHQAYLKGEYEKGLGIVETSLSLGEENYLIPSIYLYLVGAMNAMSADKIELGKEYFLKAYNLAKPDELLEPVGEHHGLLQGLIEICLKKSEKEYYEKIIAITYRFSYGWRRVHNPMTSENVADTLTTTEFSVAMLANRGWTNNEIADYLEVNVNTVKTHITSVFNKLGINSRKELNEFMLR